MKKFLLFFTAAVFALTPVSCDWFTDPDDPDGPENPDGPDEPDKPQEPTVYDISVQLQVDGAAFAQSGVDVELTDAAGTATYSQATDESGVASFKLLAGAYSASATYKTAAEGVRIVYNGANANIVVKEDGNKQFPIELQKVESKQIIIKELYFGGCTNPETNKGYTDDAYIIIYNNSDIEADASNIVFSFVGPYNGNGTNKYITDGKLLYEDLDWIPAYGAIWWFQTEVKIPAYSQVVVAIYGAVNHTQTVPTSVDLSNSAYYWMSNVGIAAYTNKKYVVAESIPTAQYLTCSPISQGNAWTMSNSSPAVYIGKMDAAAAEALSKNSDAYDHTLGTSAAFNIAKFPKANVVDAVEAWSTANVAKSAIRFSADINTGYVAITNNKGYTVYRNVDKEATEALPENAGKIVYDYAGGTVDVEGTTDPSGIDAEASIAAGAHIIYSETNDTSKDFHQRKVASIKK